MSTNEDLLPNVMQSFDFDDGNLPSLEPFAFELNEVLSAPYWLELSLAAKDPSVDESKLIGHACTLTLTRGGLVRHINGLVAEATFTGIAADHYTPQGNLPTGILRLTIVPALWMLGQRKNCRIFQGLKVTDILKKVLEEALGDYGRKVTMKTSKSYQELEYCTQYDETDLEFVQRLMATEGIMSYFKQGETVEELVLFDDADTYVELVTMNHGKVPFETSVVQGQSLETVRQFDVDSRLTQTTVSVRNFNWSRGGTPNDSAAQGKDSLQRDREWYLGEAPVALRALGGDGAYATTSAQGQVKLGQESARSRTHLAHGAGDVTGLTPGVVFDLENALRVELDRKYLVTSVRHAGARPGDIKKGTFAGDIGEVVYSNTFDCVASDVLFRLPIPPRRFVQTTQTAVVVGDEDVTTDVHGRIKVQFHWDRQGTNDIRSSCWVRVAQPSAGIGFGHVFIPRKGQEVVVTFLDGDPDKPLVIGSVFNGINSPPYELPAEKTRSVIRTRSTPDGDGYNEISFEDNKDSEQFYVQAQKDMKELVKHDHEVLIKNDERLTVEKNQTEEIGEDQSLTVKGNRSKTVKKNQTEEIGEDQSLTVKGNRSKTVEKNENIEVHGNRTTTVSKDESLTVQANRTTSVAKNSQLTVSGSLSETITKDVSQAYDANHSRSIKGNQNLSVEKNKTESVKDTYALTTDKTFSLTQGKTQLNLSQDRVTLNAGSKITITRGDATITIDDRGRISIKTSAGIVFECGGSKINLTSSVVIIKSGSKVTVQ